MNGRTCLWVHVSVRVHSTRTSLSSSKYSCDRGSQKSRPGICRRSARLATLLMNPRTVSTGSLLEYTNLSKRPRSELQSSPLLNVQARDHYFFSDILLSSPSSLGGSQSTPTHAGGGNGVGEVEWGEGPPTMSTLQGHLECVS